MADAEPSQPLHFWQLHSLIGRKPILSILTNFYNRVYDDDDEDYAWFKKAFTDLASREHHIVVQEAFWIDSFGGGRLYPGGMDRLKYHHTSYAEDVMHARGAERWMYHMRQALKDHESELNAVDVRVFPCIVDFLKTKMMSYAENHGWTYDDRDFDFAQDQEKERTPLDKDSSINFDPIDEIGKPQEVERF